MSMKFALKAGLIVLAKWAFETLESKAERALKLTVVLSLTNLVSLLRVTLYRQNLHHNRISLFSLSPCRGGSGGNLIHTVDATVDAKMDATFDGTLKQKLTTQCRTNGQPSVIVGARVVLVVECAYYALKIIC